MLSKNCIKTYFLKSRMSLRLAGVDIAIYIKINLLLTITQPYLICENLINY